MHPSHKTLIAKITDAMTSLSSVVSDALSSARFALLSRKARKERILNRLNRRYARRIEQLDARAEIHSIMFFDRHRGYFNILASSREPVVDKRGQYLLEIRQQCRNVITILLLRNVTRQHVALARRVDAEEAEEYARAAAEIDRSAKNLLAHLRTTDVPTHMLETEYGTMK